MTIGFLAGGRGLAETLVREDFERPDLVGEVTAGWAGPWRTETGTPRIVPGEAGDLELAAFGNHVALDGNTRISRILDTSDSGPLAKAGLVAGGLVGVPGRTLYVGFLQRISTVPGAGPGGTDAVRYYAVEFKTGGGDEQRVLEIGHDDRSHAGPACYGAASVVNSGRNDVEPGQFQSLGDETAEVNQLVVKFSFGPDGVDRVDVFRNPPSRTGAPPPVATLRGRFRFDRIALARFVGATPVHAVDEIRLGTQLADVLAVADADRARLAEVRLAEQQARVLAACRGQIAALAARGRDVSAWQARLAAIVTPPRPAAIREQVAALETLHAALALAGLSGRLDKLLFVKRHAYRPTHIYTEHSDGPYRPGGGIFVLDPAAPDGRVTRLFDAGGGICRDPELSFDGRRVLFSYRPSADGYYHVYQMNSDGTGLQQLTDGPFHDFDPFYLPDGRIGMTSSRCKSRTLCFWVQALTLFVMEADGSDPRPLSENNVTEFTPAMLPDGRILYTRWEYLDKSAIFVQSLWSILPDGTQARQVFGNNLIHPVSLLQARPVPGTKNIACTLAAHNGNSYGPLAIVDPTRGVDNPAGILNLTPEVNYGQGCFAPYPLDDQWCLVSYGPGEPFGLWLFHIDPPAAAIQPGRKDQPLHAPQFPTDLGTYWSAARSDRYLVYRDPEYSCVEAIPLAPRPQPPIIASPLATAADAAVGTLVLADVYRGLEDAVPRGRIKFLRIVEEMGHRDAHGRRDYEHGTSEQDFNRRYGGFMRLYAAPWENGKPAPSLQAKIVYGTVPVEADGSAHFVVPAERPIYFQALDADHNEIQRMRSYIHLKRGEQLTCIGCHELRETAPPVVMAGLSALRRDPSPITPPPFGAGPFAYERLVQPILDRRCASCHGGERPAGGLDLSARRDARGVPASFAALVRPRTDPPRPPLVHFFDSWWGESWTVPAARPRSFGAAVSLLVRVIDTAHEGLPVAAAAREDLRLTPVERQTITTWIDLNCPLWDNYTPQERVAQQR